MNDSRLGLMQIFEDVLEVLIWLVFAVFCASTIYTINAYVTEDGIDKVGTGALVICSSLGAFMSLGFMKRLFELLERLIAAVETRE